MNTVWIYVNTSKQLGDPDHIEVFTRPTPRKHGARKDPEGVAFEYEVLDEPEFQISPQRKHNG
jgi:hypothetical protein